MPRALISSGVSAPLREMISARMIRPSPDRPYSKLLTASGHVRAKASANCSTSSRRPVWRNWDFSAIVCRSCAAVMIIPMVESCAADLQHLEGFLVDVENEQLRTDGRHVLADRTEHRKTLALVDHLAVGRGESVIHPQRG